ncbi:carbohydrate ABC transporter permease [Agromyces badenianii]|uniref:carbohydrate ABC transporter permease n=1 Tax=Agromyces badenianii TaxID=2080742 RepID=UPI000D59AC35|nr:carbohydrate ABC transporter permease [Agromyces badenianii]PWC05326.1 sugar ABC transporter permease [Agromyces badenianii]
MTRTRRVRASLVASYAVLLVWAAVSLFPIVWMVSAAFKSADQVLTVPIQWIPREWHPENFVEALFEPRFAGESFITFLWNSTLVAALTALASIALSLMVGYGFAKFRFRGRDGLMWTLLGSTLLPFSAVLIPLYLVIRQLGMIDTLWALIIPFVLTGQAIFLSRQFVLAIPSSYIEAARIDGASEWGIFVRVIVPMAAPAITTVGVMTFLLSWNQFLWPLVVAESQSTFTAPLGLSLLGLGSTFQTDYNIWMAAATLAVLPPLAFFIVFERPYMRGLELMSGVK